MKHNISQPAEKAFFFPGSGNRNLFGFLHYADPVSSSTGIVYCHSFAEEKNMSHAVVVKAARMFAAAGFPVFRFDFSGCGDSEGDLQFSSVEDWQQDLDAAIEIFRQETGVSQCLLWGLRLGAGLVLLRQERNDIAGLILWQPVLDFSVHMKQFLRRAISTHISQGKEGTAMEKIEDVLQRDGLTHVIGYPVSKDLHDSFSGIGDQPAGVVPSVPIFLLSLSLMEQPAFAIKKYAQQLKEAGSSITLQHVKAKPFWDHYWQWECQKSTEATLAWLQDLSS